MTVEEKFNHLIPAVVGEVDIDIREFVHGHPVAVEEAAEVEVESDGADAGNAEAVADEGVGGGAAGDPVDPFPAAILQKLPDEEKVVGVADLADDPKLFGKLAENPAVEGGFWAVAAAGAVDHQATEKIGRGGAVGRGETGEAQSAEIKRKGTLFGKVEGFTERSGIPSAAAQGLGGGGKREVTPMFAGILLSGTGESADGLDNLVSGPISWLEITDLRQKKGCRGKGIASPGWAAGGGNRDQAGGVVTQKGAGRAGLGKNPAQVGVAGPVFDVEQDGAGEWGGAFGSRGNLSPKNGVEAGFPGGEEELDGGVKVRVGQTDGRQV